MELDLRLESVMEGVLVTGTARARAKGECVRCLEPLEQELEADFQEMFSYPDADDRGRVKAEPADDAEEDEDRLFIEDGLFDLEAVLRDAVVLALPMQPVCQEDCPGLCSECGARLADAPPPVAVEGCGPHPGCVRALPRAQAAAHRVPRLRHLQQAPGPRGLSGW
jgi:uncharacterized protein